MAIFLPTNQKRLTNVSIVRLRKGGKRFEVACYPNKVNAWRSHLEVDLDEVLHTQTVFINVSKGEFAKKGDLEKVFGTADQSEICRQILAKGELQVTEKERQSNLDALFSDTAKLVSQKTVNPVTQRAYSVAIIEKAMRGCHLRVLPNRSAKQQASEAITQLQRSGELDLELAMMRVQLAVLSERVNPGVLRKVRAVVRERAVEMIADEMDEAALVMTCLVEPGALNELEELVQNETRGRYELEVSRQAGAITLGAEAKAEESEEEKDEKEGEDGKKGKKHRRRRKDKGDAAEEEKTKEKGEDQAKDKEEDEGEKEEEEERKTRRRRRRKKSENDGEAKPSTPVPPKQEEDSWEDHGHKRKGRRRRKSGRSASESKAP